MRNHPRRQRIRSKKEPVKLLIIEAGAELEMGIPPNIAVLVSAVKSKGFKISVFSTNDYKSCDYTGDETRVNTLQVPPTDAQGVSIIPKKTDMVYDFQKMVETYRPDIIGLSATEATYSSGLRLLRAIRDKDIFTIVGGIHPTLCPDEVSADDSVDSICIGEGEEALTELCQSFQKNRVDYRIKNLWFKIDSEIIRNPLRPLANIDQTPFQDWSPWSVPPRAMKAMSGKVRPTALVELSRGCPFRCNYCANHFLNINFKHNYRERSVGRFIEEVVYLRDRHNVKFIYISDETILTTDENRFQEFLKKYSELKLPFWCETRPEHVEYEKIKALKEIGLHAINIGVESGDSEFRKKVLNRFVSDDKIISGIRDAARAGVRVGANVIAGFPGENRNQIFKSIELIQDAKPSSTMVHLFQPYRKTPLRETCVKMGLIKDDYICGDYRMNAIGTGHLSTKELLGLQRTFNLYVDLPKNRWDEIREAELFDNKGNAAFRCLAKEYQLKHFGRTSF